MTIAEIKAQIEILKAEYAKDHVGVSNLHKALYHTAQVNRLGSLYVAMADIEIKLEVGLDNAAWVKGEFNRNTKLAAMYKRWCLQDTQKATYSRWLGGTKHMSVLYEGK